MPASQYITCAFGVSSCQALQCLIFCWPSILQAVKNHAVQTKACHHARTMLTQSLALAQEDQPCCSKQCMNVERPSHWSFLHVQQMGLQDYAYSLLYKTGTSRQPDFTCRSAPPKSNRNNNTIAALLHL